MQLLNNAKQVVKSFITDSKLPWAEDNFIEPNTFSEKSFNAIETILNLGLSNNVANNLNTLNSLESTNPNKSGLKLISEGIRAIYADLIDESEVSSKVKINHLSQLKTTNQKSDLFHQLIQVAKLSNENTNSQEISEISREAKGLLNLLLLESKKNSLGPLSKLPITTARSEQFKENFNSFSEELFLYGSKEESYSELGKLLQHDHLKSFDDFLEQRLKNLLNSKYSDTALRETLYQEMKERTINLLTDTKSLREQDTSVQSIFLNTFVEKFEKHAKDFNIGKKEFDEIRPLHEAIINLLITPDGSAEFENRRNTVAKLINESQSKLSILILNNEHALDLVEITDPIIGSKIDPVQVHSLSAEKADQLFQEIYNLNTENKKNSFFEVSFTEENEQLIHHDLLLEQRRDPIFKKNLNQLEELYYSSIGDTVDLPLKYLSAAQKKEYIVGNISAISENPKMLEAYKNLLIKHESISEIKNTDDELKAFQNVQAKFFIVLGKVFEETQFKGIDGEKISFVQNLLMDKLYDGRTQGANEILRNLNEIDIVKGLKYEDLHSTEGMEASLTTYVINSIKRDEQVLINNIQEAKNVLNITDQRLDLVKGSTLILQNSYLGYFSDLKAENGLIQSDRVNAFIYNLENMRDMHGNEHASEFIPLVKERLEIAQLVFSLTDNQRDILKLDGSSITVSDILKAPDSMLNLIKHERKNFEKNIAENGLAMNYDQAKHERLRKLEETVSRLASKDLDLEILQYISVIDKQKGIKENSNDLPDIKNALEERALLSKKDSLLTNLDNWHQSLREIKDNFEMKKEFYQSEFLSIYDGIDQANKAAMNVSQENLQKENQALIKISNNNFIIDHSANKIPLDEYIQKYLNLFLTLIQNLGQFANSITSNHIQNHRQLEENYGAA
jgi:predicted GNAT superfamily acetyltransferase